MNKYLEQRDGVCETDSNYSVLTVDEGTYKPVQQWDSLVSLFWTILELWGRVTKAFVN